MSTQPEQADNSFASFLADILPGMLQNAEQEHAWKAELERLSAEAANNSVIVAPTTLWAATAYIWASETYPDKNLRFEDATTGDIYPDFFPKIR